MKHSHFNPFTLSTYLTAEGPSSEFIWPLLVGVAIMLLYLAATILVFEARSQP